VNEFRRTALGVVGSLALVGTAAAVTYGVATVLDVGTSDSDMRVQETVAAIPAEQTAEAAKESHWTGSLLITADRDRLSICINTVGLTNKAVVEASAVASVGAALAEVKKSAAWQSAMEETPVAANTEVVAGCPGGTLTAAPTRGEWGDRVANYWGRTVKQASPHVIHVHVLPESEILRIVGPAGNHHVAIEEVLCSGDECTVATQALYYSPSDLADLELLTREMEFALSLRSEPW
jgi:hypothetical protein